MKIFLRSLALALLAFTAKAETEPNNTYNYANLFALNSSDAGSLSPGDLVDWWYVTVTTNGKLIINTTSDAGINIGLSLFDVDGTLQLAGSDTITGIHEATHYDNLRAGNYFIRAEIPGGTGNYTITSVFTPATNTSETEPNTTYNYGNLFPVNGSATGNIGYYTAGNTDMIDWWYVTVPSNGQLVINTTCENTMELDLFLYDIDGTLLLAGSDIPTGTLQATHYNNLLPGNYFIKAELTGGYGSYTISSSHTPATFTAETEPNTTYNYGNLFSVNGSATGNIGYYSGGYTDVVDWWYVTVPSNGKLDISSASEATVEIDLFLYDIDGTLQLAGSDIGTGTAEATHYNNLLPGNYFIKAVNTGGYGSYTISSTHTPATFTAETEPNTTYNYGNAFSVNGSANGNIGYYSGGYTDVVDWWYVTVPSNGKLDISSTSEATVEIDLFLYDIDGTLQLAGSDIGTGTAEATHYNNLLPGNYFIKAVNTGGYGSYTIASTHTPATFTAETEPNTTYNYGNLFPVNGSATGNIGYYSGGYTDVVDWWYVTVTSDGQLTVNTTSEATVEINLSLYDINGTLQLAGSDIGTGINEATHYDNLMPGNYFIKAENAGGYGSYTIASTHVPAIYANDIEPNTTYNYGNPLAFNDSSTGHIGYYSGGYTDTIDWWYVTISSQLDTLWVEAITTSTLALDYMTLYSSSDLVNPINTSPTMGDTVRIAQLNVAPGNYYIRLIKSSGYGSYKLYNGPDFNIVTSIQQIDPYLFSVYPNPATYNVQWSIDKTDPDVLLEVSLVNMLGEIVSTELTALSRGEISTTHLSAGIYSLQFRDKGLVIAEYKVVKQ